MKSQRPFSMPISTAARPPSASPAECEDIARRLGSRLKLLAGRRLLVTGASGYLAAHLSHVMAWLNDNALERPCRLLLLQRRAPADSPLAELAERRDTEFVVQDVAAPLPPHLRADLVVHAASRASPRHYLAAPLDTIDANVSATRAILEAAQIWKSESVLYFSSGEIYGDAPDSAYPTPETWPGQVDPLGPRACYTESKRMGETLCGTYRRLFDIPVKIVRPFHIYGPGQPLDDGRVMTEFLQLRLANEAIIAQSDGSGIRAFSYIVDATCGFLAALTSDYHGEAFNIGDDRRPISIRQLAELLANLESPRLRTSFAAQQAAHLEGTPNRVCPDISKARKLLDWQPTVDLDEGLRRCLSWYRATRGAA